MKYVKSDPISGLRQGELLSNVIETLCDIRSLTNDVPEFLERTHPFAFVLSQDCDLDWDFTARLIQQKLQRLIPNVLLCEVKRAKVQAQTIVDSEGSRDSNRSRIWTRIRQNKDERYQFFESIEKCHDLQEDDEKIGELVIDFKRYFTVPTDELYVRIKYGETKRRCRLVHPYLEHLSSRFAFFQSRVALPEDHESEPGVVKRLTAS